MPTETRDVHPLVTVAELIREVAESLDGRPDITDGDLPDLARRLRAFDHIVALIGPLAEEVNQELADRMEADNVDIPHLGRLVRTEKRRQTWRDENSRTDMLETVKAEVSKRVATDPMTMEIHPALRNAAQSAIDLVFQVVSIGNPKQPFRTALGLRIDDYRSEQHAGYRIEIEEPTEEVGS